MRERTRDIQVSEKQIEILARRLLPEIRKFFSDENIRREFEEWKKNKTIINESVT